MARFTHTSPVPIDTKTYSRFRPYIRADFEKCCAHCYLHEDWAGGEGVFEIDHFRPVSLFPELNCTYENLYWSCRTCNGRKGKSSHWPSDDEMLEGIGFVDLCSDDWESQYKLLLDGSLIGLTKNAKYTIKTIRLNRPFLIRLRKWAFHHNVLLDLEREASFPLPSIIEV